MKVVTGLIAAGQIATVCSFSSHLPFHLKSSIPTNHGSPLYMSDESFPSDSSEEENYTNDEVETVDVNSESFVPTPGEELVTSILDDLPAKGTIVGSDSTEMRSKINEALLKLEAMNPTKNASTSPLLNGVWSLRYAGGYEPSGAIASPTRDLALFLYSGGYSPGLFALSLSQKLPERLVDCGELEIAISRSQPRIEAKIGVKFLGGASNDICVKARLEVDSDIRLTETYESSTLFGNNVDIPTNVQYSRDLYVTYLDEDLLVVRDGSGVPEVLLRKEKIFTGNWGTETSEVEEMSAPGEGESAF